MQRMVVVLIGTIAALALIGASVFMNWRFGFSLGRTELDGNIYGGAVACADLIKATLPFFIIWAYRDKQWLRSFAGIILWGVFSLTSLTASIGFAALNRAEVTGERAAQSEAVAELKEGREETKLAIKSLRPHRSAGEVKALIEKALNLPIKRRRRVLGTLKDLSGNCNKITRRTIKGCDLILELRAELAIATEENRLRSKSNQLEEKLARVIVKSPKGGSDPQAAILVLLLGHSLENVKLGLVLLLAVLVELGSGLGLFITWQKFDRTKYQPIEEVSEKHKFATNGQGGKIVQNAYPVFLE